MNMAIIGQQMVGFQGISYLMRFSRAFPSLHDQCGQPGYEVDFARGVAVAEDMGTRMGDRDSDATRENRERLLL